MSNLLMTDTGCVKIGEFVCFWFFGLFVSFICLASFSVVNHALALPKSTIQSSVWRVAAM